MSLVSNQPKRGWLSCFVVSHHSSGLYEMRSQRLTFSNHDHEYLQVRTLVLYRVFIFHLPSLIVHLFSHLISSHRIGDCTVQIGCDVTSLDPVRNIKRHGRSETKREKVKRHKSKNTCGGRILMTMCMQSKKQSERSEYQEYQINNRSWVIMGNHG